MKKFITAIAVLLFFVPLIFARAQTVFFYAWPPFSCRSNMAGFNLVMQQDGYRLTGPIYAPLPGYTAALSDLSFDPGQPANAAATLTLIPPSNIIRPRLAVVPPLWIDYSFSSPVPLYKLTIYIANPFNRFDTQITCLLTGAIQ